MSLSKTVQSTLPYLIVLYESINNTTLKAELLSNKKVIYSLTEIAYNLLLKNIPLTEAERKKFLRIESELVLLAKTGNLSEKLSLLKTNKGSGVISVILSTALPKLM